MPLYEEKFICPFAIRFSQARIRPTFQDGREVEASMEEVEAVECPKGSVSSRYDLLLRAPFPPIEIIRWWPKLREEDGETLLDENGKTILGEPCWFTFDNRRLYCLQAAAAKHWPASIAAIVHIMHDLPVSKCAPKKFRTTDLGQSVRISRRFDVEPIDTWSWMEATGCEDAASKEALQAVFTDSIKEHWSELSDVPADFMGPVSYSQESYRTREDKEEDKDEDTSVNTRTARRLLKAGGSRVSRGGTEAAAAAAAVAAAQAAAKSTALKSPAKRSDDSAPDAPTSDSAASEWPPSAGANPTLESLMASMAGWPKTSQADGLAGYANTDFSQMSAEQLASAASMYQMAGASYNAQSVLSWQFQQQMMQQMQAMQAMQQMQQRAQQQRALQQQRLVQERMKQQQQQKLLQQRKEAEKARNAAEALLKASKAPEAGAVGSTLLAAANGKTTGFTVASLFEANQLEKSSNPPLGSSLTKSQASAGASTATPALSISSPPSPPLSEEKLLPAARSEGDDDEDNCTQQ